MSLQQSNEYVAPIRVSAALLYECLRAYSRIRQKQPSVCRPQIDALWKADSEKFRRHRNSIFHVERHSSNALNADLGATSAKFMKNTNNNILVLYREISEFFGAIC
jgi:hypothetical protein